MSTDDLTKNDGRHSADCRGTMKAMWRDIRWNLLGLMLLPASAVMAVFVYHVSPLAWWLTWPIWIIGMVVGFLAFVGGGPDSV